MSQATCLVPAVDLASAMLSSSATPTLMLDGDMHVLGASTSFCDAFDIDPARTAGVDLPALGHGEWNVPQLTALLSVAAVNRSHLPPYEMDMGVGTSKRRLVLAVRNLDYGIDEPARLLLSVADVTQERANARLKDALIFEKGVLLHEIQHRVANSLQIIASVLMLSARNVQSEETKGHLQVAHSRVMSVAALQQQLIVSGTEQVEMRPYLQGLCDSIGASMIADRDQIALHVTGGGGMVEADTSVSLGLIVTELVINALKHAFPSGRHGTITVDYHYDDPAWFLSVRDDGVGMPGNLDRAQAGLGTSIVEALARKLRAVIHVDDQNPGTAIHISHSADGAANQAGQAPL